MLLVAQIRSVWSIGPVEDDFLIRRTGFLEEIVVIRVVEIAPDAWKRIKRRVHF